MKKVFVPVVEFNIVDHCNLSCKQCSHLAPYTDVKFSDFDSFKRDIDRMASIINVGIFKFLGGEPLLHKKIVDYIKYVKQAGFTKKIMVTTNGVMLPRMSDEFFELIDSISVSIYPNKINKKEIEKLLTNKFYAIGLQFVINDKGTMREMNRTEVSDELTTLETFSKCLVAHEWGCNVIHDGRFYRCSRPIYTNNWIKHIAKEQQDFKADGLDIHAADFSEKVGSYVKSDVPLEACKWCRGTSGKATLYESL